MKTKEYKTIFKFNSIFLNLKIEKEIKKENKTYEA